MVEEVAVWEEVVRHQRGVVSRRQALACGLTDEKIEAQLLAGRWQRVYRGVYATFTGPLPRRSRLWAVILRAGAGAVLSHETAAELAGLADGESRPIHVTVPASRKPRRIPGVVVHRSRRLDLARHPGRSLPQTRVEETVLDLTQTAACVEDAMGWLARAVGARVTTPARVRQHLAARAKARWRGVLAAALADVGEGCHSLLELHYLRRVERAHDLPRADRQSRAVRNFVARYRDVHYRRYRTVVELDGLAAHPDHLRWRDRRRTNAEAMVGNQLLRYGFGDIEEYACEVAVEVAGILALRGWSGRARPCGRPGCPAGSIAPRDPCPA